MQIQPLPSTTNPRPGGLEPESAGAAYLLEAAAPAASHRSGSVATDNLRLPTALDSALPDLAPAERPPAEHAAAPEAPFGLPDHSSHRSGQLQAGPFQGAGRKILLPQMKLQIGALEDKELEQRLCVLCYCGFPAFLFLGICLGFRGYFLGSLFVMHACSHF